MDYEPRGSVIEIGKEYMGLTPRELSQIEPRFRNHNELPLEARTDPDYHINQLEKLNGDNLAITCSKCHHCR